MPFPTQTPRGFNKSSIEVITPNQKGCYALLAKGVVIYVGKGDIRERLLAHLNGDNMLIVLQRPDSCLTMVTSDMDRMEKGLILEFNPCCNQKVG